MAAAVFLALAVVPALSEGYVVYILPQYMLFGMMAMSLVLLWGFMGTLSFGQAAFFALGAYAMGLVMKAGWGGNPAYLGLLIAILAGAALAALIGVFLFSAGVRNTYFVLVTLALSIMAEQIAVSQSQITGGWNGLYIDRLDLTFPGLEPLPLHGDAPMYYVVLIVAALTYTLLAWLMRARFGRILVGIRENEDRMISLGFRTPLFKTAAFALAGAVAAFAGALYGSHANFVAPSLGGVLFSTEVVVWVAIGGRHSLLAGLVAGIAVASLSNYLSAITPRYWQLVLGILFMVAIVALRGGVAGALARLRFGRGG